MSGKRQHYIPRFLQEGFADEQLQTWVYRVQSRPFKTNIINVGVEGYFYTLDGDTGADDLITIAESYFSPLINDLRSSRLEALKSPLIPELLVNLEIRTRHLRQNFLLAGSYMFEKLLERLEDPEFFKDFILRKIRQDPSIMKDSISKKIPGITMSSNYLESLTDLAISFAPNFIEMNKGAVSDQIADLKLGFPDIIKHAVKLGHIKSLKNDIAPKKRLEKYKNTSFSLHKIIDKNLILGDSIVFFNVGGDLSYKPFLDKDRTMNAVFLPIDHQTILVGSNNGFTDDFSCLRAAIASCSLEFFISKDELKSDFLENMEIGKSSAPIGREEMDEIIFKNLNS